MTTYLGDKHPESRRRNNFFKSSLGIFLVLGLIASGAIYFLFFEGISLSPEERFLITLDEVSFSEGDLLYGDVVLKVMKGEMLPYNSVLRVSYNDYVREVPVYEMIGDENKVAGLRYIEGLGDLGVGEGYGIPAQTEVFPEVIFQLVVRGSDEIGEDIVSGGGTEVDEGASAGEEVVDGEETGGLETEIMPDGTSEEVSDIVVEGESEGIVSESDGVSEDGDIEGDSSSGDVETSDSDLVDDGEDFSGGDSASGEDSSGGSDTSSGDSSGDSVSSSEGDSSGGESSSSDSGDSGGDSGGDGPSLSPDEAIIEGSLKANEPFVYFLEEGESVALVPGSVKAGEETLEDSVVSLEISGRDVRVSTDYSRIEEGFGEGFVSDEVAFEVVYDLDDAGFVVESGGQIGAEIMLEEISLLETSEMVVVKSGNESNKTESSNAGGSVMQESAVLGEEVCFVMEVVGGNDNIARFDLPSDATVKDVQIGGESDEIESLSGGENELPLAEGEKARVRYCASAPRIVEEEIGEEKVTLRVVGSEDPDLHYEDVEIRYVLPDEFRAIGESARVYWIEGGQYLPATYDSDAGELLWVSDLSEQNFEIIFISRAEHLDSDRNFLSDVYEEVRALDGIWSESILDGEYVRVTFHEMIDASNDITIYPRVVEDSPLVEVYVAGEDELIATFNDLSEGEKKVFLVDLVGSHDTFDLKILGGSVEFDHIVDPTDGAPEIDFTAQTPDDGEILTVDNLEIGLETSDMSTHYSLVDFDRDLLLWLRMEDFSGNIPMDGSSYEHSVTFFGGEPESRTGVFGNSAFIDLENDRSIAVDPSPVLDFKKSGKMSFSLWLNVSSSYYGFGVPLPILHKEAPPESFCLAGAPGEPSACAGYILALNESNSLSFGIPAQSEGIAVNVVGTDTISPDTWYHVVVTYDNGNATIYLDGVRGESKSESGFSDAAGTSLAIGRWEDYTLFYGEIDEFMMFNRTLTIDEVRALYDSSSYSYQREFRNLSARAYDFVGRAVDTQGNLASTEERSVTITKPIILTTCGELNVANSEYILANDIGTVTPVGGTCFVISADNVTLVGNSHIIRGDLSSSSLGINATGVDGLVIMNVTIKEFGKGIYMSSVSGGYISDMTLYNNSAASGRSAMDIFDSRDLVVQRTNFSRTGFVTLSITRGENNTVRDSLFEKSRGDVVIMRDGRGHSVISNSFISTTGGLFLGGNNILLFNVNGSRIENNTLLSTESNAITFDNSHQNTVLNVRESAENLGVSGLVLYRSHNNNITNFSFDYRDQPQGGFPLDINSSSNNHVRGGTLTRKVTGIAISTIRHEGTSENNTFDGVSFSGTGSNNDIISRSGSIITLKDMNVQRFSFINSYITLKKSDGGEIKYLQPVTASGTNLNQTILIKYNAAIVESGLVPALNKPANVTLYGGVGGAMTSPRIFKNGQLCPAGECFNFTSLKAENVTFAVVGWTNYSIGDYRFDVNITSPTQSSPRSVSVGEEIPVRFRASVNGQPLMGNVLVDGVKMGSFDLGQVEDTLIYEGFESPSFVGWTPSGALWNVCSSVNPENCESLIEGTRAAHFDGPSTDLTLTQNGVTDLTSYLDANLSAYIYINSFYTNSPFPEYVCLDYSCDGGASWNRNVGGDGGVGGLCQDGGFDAVGYRAVSLDPIFTCGLVPNLKIRFRASAYSGDDDGLVDKVTLTASGTDLPVTHISNGLWEVNVTVPLGLEVGSHDLTLNASDGITYEKSGDTERNAISYLGSTISACGQLSEEGEYYTLTQDIAGVGVGCCVNITADGITFDGGGNEIVGTGARDSSAVCADNVQGITIKRANISRFYYGIDLRNVNTSKVMDSEFRSNHYSVDGSPHEEGFGLRLLSARGVFVNSSVFGATVSSAIGIDGGADNMIISSLFTGVKHEAIYLYGYGRNNSIKYVSDISSQWPSSRDLLIESGVNGTVIEDSVLESYSIANNTLKVRKNGVGEIFFTKGVNASGTNFSDDIEIRFNLVDVDSSGKTGLNRSANITLYGHPAGTLPRPSILRDGNVCPPSECRNFTSLTDETVVFGVNSWTNYSLGFVSDLYGCGILDSPNTVYTLRTSLPSISGTCFVINAENVTLDGLGNSLDGDSNGFGVFVNRTKNAIVRGLSIYEFSDGVYIFNSTNTQLNSITVAASSQRGVYSLNSSRDTYVDLKSADELSVIGHAGNLTIVDLGLAEMEYSFDPKGVDLVFRNSQYGEIRFLSPVNGSGSDLRNHVRLDNNLALVDSSGNRGLNRSALITFINNLYAGSEDVVMKRDNVVCNAMTTPRCYNLTSLNADTVVFNVSSWTTYEVEPVNSPPVVKLISPEDAHFTQERGPTLIWNGTDSEDALLTYELNVTCFFLPGNNICPSDSYVLSIPGSFPEGELYSHIMRDLKYFDDEGYYYTWSVRANDGNSWGPWAFRREIYLLSLVDITLLNDAVNFGTIEAGQANDTSDNSPQPFVIENSGNVYVNVSLNATRLWVNRPFESDEYRFKVDNILGASAFNVLQSPVTWNRMPIGTFGMNKTVDLNYTGDDDLEVDVFVAVPSGEPAGEKHSTVIFMAEWSRYR